jgi:hypothetical protein
MTALRQPMDNAALTPLLPFCHISKAAKIYPSAINLNLVTVLCRHAAFTLFIRLQIHYGDARRQNASKPNAKFRSIALHLPDFSIGLSPDNNHPKDSKA